MISLCESNGFNGKDILGLTDKELEELKVGEIRRKQMLSRIQNLKKPVTVRFIFSLLLFFRVCRISN